MVHFFNLKPLLSLALLHCSFVYSSLFSSLVHVESSLEVAVCEFASFLSLVPVLIAGQIVFKDGVRFKMASCM